MGRGSDGTVLGRGSPRPSNSAGPYAGAEQRSGRSEGALATYRLVRSPPQNWTRPSFHTLAPAGLIRDLDGVVQPSLGHGEGADLRTGLPPELTPALRRRNPPHPGNRPRTAPPHPLPDIAQSQAGTL